MFLIFGSERKGIGGFISYDSRTIVIGLYPMINYDTSRDSLLVSNLKWRTTRKFVHVDLCTYLYFAWLSAFSRLIVSYPKHHLVKSSQQALVQQKLVSEPMHRGTYVVAMVVMSLSM